MRVPTDALNLGGAAVAWLALAYKVPGLRRNRRDGSLLAFCGTLLFIALSLTVLDPPVYLWIDRLARLPNLAELLANGLALASGCAALAFLSHLNYPAARARRSTALFTAIGVAALAAMGLLFVRIPAGVDQPDFWNHYAGAPFAAPYRLVYLAYVGFVLANVIRLAWRYAQIPNRPSMTIGLRLVAIGGAIGQIYVISEMLRVLGPGAGMSWLSAEPALIIKILTVVAVVVLVIGSTMPSWGPRLGVDAAGGRLGEFQSLRRLYPLWRDLSAAVPSISLGPAPARFVDTLDPRDVHFRLYRRVVEMRDALLLLRPPGHAEGSQSDGRYQLEAGATERSLLVSIAEAASTTDLPESTRTSEATASSNPGLDLVADVRALEELSRRYRRALSGRRRRSWFRRPGVDARPRVIGG